MVHPSEFLCAHRGWIFGIIIASTHSEKGLGYAHIKMQMSLVSIVIEEGHVWLFHVERLICFIKERNQIRVVVTKVIADWKRTVNEANHFFCIGCLA